jgi:hypothetical protein
MIFSGFIVIHTESCKSFRKVELLQMLYNFEEIICIRLRINEASTWQQLQHHLYALEAFSRQSSCPTAGSDILENKTS